MYIIYTIGNLINVSVWQHSNKTRQCYDINYWFMVWFSYVIRKKDENQSINSLESVCHKNIVLGFKSLLIHRMCSEEIILSETQWMSIHFVCQHS